MSDLTDVERDMLAFERDNTWWKHAGQRAAAILDRFGLSTILYDQRLHVLVWRPEAAATDPLTVNRLRGILASRQRSRSIRELGL